MWRIEIAGKAALSAISDRAIRSSPIQGQGNYTTQCVVFATFDRSCYLENQGGRLVCLGELSVGCGPLNALVAQFKSPAVGTILSLDIAGTIPWQPTHPVGSWTLQCHKRIHAAVRGLAPIDGLGGLLQGSHSPLIAHAKPALKALQHWLQIPHRTDFELSPVKKLLGLGPGLTPSGDDYLCGALIAMHSFGFGKLATQLWEYLLPDLSSLTNRISAAHLAAAAEGEGHEALHACLNAVVQDNTHPDTERQGDLATALTQLAQVGHSSGFDALAGAVAALNTCADLQLS